ncbi:MAG: 4Fe-4S dicluster-binding protein [Thermincola sp.]|nr:4Fe-4S dicluster-binding protein [Thermincola sp.]MDT3702811.1 4Fe-4S dicluster-binding protein [Thermincola sp.]
MAEKKYKFSYVIEPSSCAGCAQCWTECKFNAVGPDTQTLTSYLINQDECTRCGKCYRGCPIVGCIQKVS